MLSSVRLSRQASHSSWVLILWRRFQRVWVNWMGDLRRLIGFQPQLQPEKICQAAGVSISSLDPYALKLFKAICTSWNSDKNLTLSGFRLLESYYRDTIQLREKIHGLAKEHPEIRQLPVEGIFILGWPRVGSTFLHNLLSCDPLAKGPPLWQLVNPIEQNQSKSERIRDTGKFLDYYYDLEPELFMLHEMYADRPDECCHLFEQSWVDRHSPIISDNFQHYLTVLRSLSPEESDQLYEFYKLTLQTMAFCNGDQPISHHVLKDNTHCLYPSSILRVFPNSKVLILRRKPSKVFHSCIAGIALVARYYHRVRNINLTNLAGRVLDWMRISEQNMEDFRYHLNDQQKNQVLDVQFDDLIRDPVETVRSIYKHFSLEFTPEFEQNMRNFMQENQQFRKSKPNVQFPTSPLPLSDNQIDSMFFTFETPNGPSSLVNPLSYTKNSFYFNEGENMQLALQPQ